MLVVTYNLSMTKKKKTTEDVILEETSAAVFLGSLGFIASELQDEFVDDEPFAEEKAAEKNAALEKKNTKEFGEW